MKTAMVSVLIISLMSAQSDFSIPFFCCIIRGLIHPFPSNLSRASSHFSLSYHSNYPRFDTSSHTSIVIIQHIVIQFYPCGFSQFLLIIQLYVYLMTFQSLYYSEYLFISCSSTSSFPSDLYLLSFPSSSFNNKKPSSTIRTSP